MKLRQTEEAHVPVMQNSFPFLYLLFKYNNSELANLCTKNCTNGQLIEENSAHYEEVNCAIVIENFQHRNSGVMSLLYFKENNSISVLSTSMALTIRLHFSSFEKIDQLPLPFDFVVRDTEDKRDANTATLISSASLARATKMVSLSKVADMPFVSIVFKFLKDFEISGFSYFLEIIYSSMSPAKPDSPLFLRIYDSSTFKHCFICEKILFVAPQASNNLRDQSKTSSAYS
ncbi:hypothetical protein SADUNF_Sadunf02G0009900 [Salix dunnii]|uniref:Uncharacterized protein n=1 Tax=Salix dunnii TaxID=1413687 RepID=A0A835N5N0_9ROSI|nr:hypothetical protein SADUNF_Sadunf02G0009900 [Salix dunnii]